MERKLTPEQDAIIAREYMTGLSTVMLAKKFKACPQAISRAVVRGGGRIRTMSEANGANARKLCEERWIFTPEQRQEIATLYQQGMSCDRLGAMFNVNAAVISHAVKSSGGMVREYTRVLTLDEAAFDRDTPEACYFAGLLFADGCVTHTTRHGGTGKNLALGLSGDDGIMVHKFKEFLGASQKVSSKRPGSNLPLKKPPKLCHRLTVGSRRLVEALERFGIHPRKSLTASVPDRLLDNPHWWRGVIDGDGWFTRVHKQSPTLGLVGSIATVEQFLAYARTFGRCKSAPMQAEGNQIWAIRIHGITGLKVTRALYEGATLSLPRKQRLAEEWMKIHGHKLGLNSPSGQGGELVLANGRATWG